MTAHVNARLWARRISRSEFDDVMGVSQGGRENYVDRSGAAMMDSSGGFRLLHWETDGGRVGHKVSTAAHGSSQLMSCSPISFCGQEKI